MSSITTLSTCIGGLILIVDAVPAPSLNRIHRRLDDLDAHAQRRDREESQIVGQKPIQRTILNCAVICSIFLLGVALGLRVRRMEFRRFRFIHFLVVLQTCLAACFALSVGIIGPGFGIRTSDQCYSAILICVVFYMLAKLAMYQFLVERAHVIRSAFLTRFHDRIWMTFTGLILLGPGVLTVAALITPTHNFDPKAGTCYIGFNRYVSFLVHTLDISINFSLTVVFVWLLWPVIRVRIHTAGIGVSGSTPTNNTASIDSATARKGPNPNTNLDTSEQARHENLAAVLIRLGARTGILARRRKASRSKRSSFISIRTMLWRNFAASTAILMSTTTNGILFFVWNEAQPAWMCLSICVIDISFCVLVVHWLTFGGSTSDSTSPHVSNVLHTNRGNGHPLHPPYSDCSPDAPLPELKTYEEMTTERTNPPIRPEQSYQLDSAL
ncbi:hypothetical protein B0J11DRAFT_207961 [Dendryphion nanum]|uniref:G-protein coupled receptors family 2 profile 2 domain-containing protein n=1 Tax=Dendryphion nanum TaxID=256645 RepID=A0A9P9CZU4_9PLEO|nr:hypothetical protein B0J11DRAFT_207961 [Dendryphion nanum]